MAKDFIESVFSLENKVAVITGATGYFGKYFSECFLKSGAKVILYGRGGKVKDIASHLVKKYKKNKVNFYEVDCYDEILYEKFLIQTVKSEKTIDILVNNAFEFSRDTGFNHPSGKLENISKKQWMRSLEAGIYWHALATQVIVEKMKKQHSGSIINISSMYGLVSPDPKLYKGTKIFNPPSYGAAKAGLIALTRYTASFTGEYGIRCNAIAAGSFPNLDNNSYNSPKDNKLLKRLINKIVLGRVGELDDLKGALIFLASDASKYITGQTIVIDGGWTIR